MQQRHRLKKGHTPPKGRGVILCYECGKPTRDHSLLEVCPELLKVLETTRLTAPRPLAAKHEQEKAEQ